MNNDDFEARMRSQEYFHSLRALPGAWIVARVDGRGFTRFTETRFEKPFDAKCRDLMVKAAKVLLEELQAVYAYTESDEISVLFRPEWDLFDREVEKLVSVSAGIASATFSQACGEAAHFDSRLWLGVDESQVVDYLRWRQADATRCALNAWCYWTLRKGGKSVASATAGLERKSKDFKNELLFEHGINFNEVPVWQRRGIGLYWEEYEKEGHNPKTQKKVATRRRRVKADFELPMKDDYSRLIRDILKTKPSRRQ